MVRKCKVVSVLLTVMLIVSMICPVAVSASSEIISSSYTVTDVRDSSKTATIGQGAGTYQMFVFGGYGDNNSGYCYNTRSVMSACSNIIDQIGSDNLTIVYFGVRYDNVADLKTSTAGLSKNLIIADLGGNLVNSSSFSKLYSDCFTFANVSGFTMPLIVFADANGKMLSSSTGFRNELSLKKELSTWGLCKDESFTASVSFTGNRDYAKAYEVLNLLNKHRADNGLSALKMDKDLLDGAMIRAQEIVVYFDHQRPDGTMCTSVSSKASGENIACGPFTCEEVMNGWKNSDGHNKNMLKDSFASVGIGVFEYDGNYYWVQLFGTGSATVPTVRNDVVSNTSSVKYENSTVVPDFVYSKYSAAVGVSPFSVPVMIGDVEVDDLTGYSLVSSDTSVFTVNGSKKVVPVGSGTATLYIKNGDITVSSMTIVISGGSTSSQVPTATPTTVPVTKPTSAPVSKPTSTPTAKPTSTPTVVNPTKAPSAVPTSVPNVTPTKVPSAVPTTVPDNPVAEAGVGGFVERLYTVAMGRESDENGKCYWTKEAMVNGKTGADLAVAFLLSPEFLNKKMSNSDFVEVLYKTFFDRDSEVAGKAYWMGQLDAGKSKTDVIYGFINSEEWANICLLYGIRSGTEVAPTIIILPNDDVIDFAERLYTTCLKRQSEQGGLTYWSNELANLRKTGSEVAKGFFFSEEIKNSGIDDSEFLTRLYKTLMDREPEAAGFNFWLGEMKAGRMSRNDVFDGFAASEEWIGICSDYGILR